MLLRSGKKQKPQRIFVHHLDCSCCGANPSSSQVVRNTHYPEWRHEAYLLVHDKKYQVKTTSKPASSHALCHVLHVHDPGFAQRASQHAY